MGYLAFVLALIGGDTPQNIVVESPNIWVTIAGWLVYGFFAIVAAIVGVWFKNWLKRKCDKHRCNKHKNYK